MIVVAGLDILSIQHFSEPAIFSDLSILYQEAPGWGGGHDKAVIGFSSAQINDSGMPSIDVISL